MRPPRAPPFWSGGDGGAALLVNVPITHIWLAPSGPRSGPERNLTITTTATPRQNPDGGLNTPYGGPLVDLIVGDERAAEMKATAKDFASLTLEIGRAHV